MRVESALENARVKKDKRGLMGLAEARALVKATKVHRKGDGEMIRGRGFLGHVDVTQRITTSSKFQRIHAQKGIPAKADKAERWHFAFLEDVQDTFLDEVERVGISEDDLLANKWTLKMMDSKPG